LFKKNLKLQPINEIKIKKINKKNLIKKINDDYKIIFKKKNNILLKKKKKKKKKKKNISFR